MVKHIRKQSGITLIEVLIAVCIIAVLAAMFFSGYTTQLKKSRDGKRKADMQKIKTSFEDYYNDNGCYPTNVSVFDNCGSTSAYEEGGFSPWLASVPCDPLDAPYQVVIPEAVCPSQFSIFTNMEYLRDPDVRANDCFSGCGDYNFGYSSDNINPSDLVAPSGEGEPTNTPAPTATPTTVIDCGSGCYRLDAIEQTCNGDVGSCTAPNCYVGQCNPSCEVDVCPVP
jgi:prepilin-type N-terminal cleavage/methylation domain-containing protein